MDCLWHMYLFLHVCSASTYTHPYTSCYCGILSLFLTSPPFPLGEAMKWQRKMTGIGFLGHREHNGTHQFIFVWACIDISGRIFLLHGFRTVWGGFGFWNLLAGRSSRREYVEKTHFSWFRHPSLTLARHCSEMSGDGGVWIDAICWFCSTLKWPPVAHQNHAFRSFSVRHSKWYMCTDILKSWYFNKQKWGEICRIAKNVLFQNYCCNESTVFQWTGCKKCMQIYLISN